MPYVPRRADYQHLILGLLPRGLAWTRDTASRLGDLAYAIGTSFARVHLYLVDDLLELQLDPRTATTAADGGLLDDWERVLGLPDPCSETPTSSLTTAERQAAAHAKLTAQGGVTAAYFVDVAAKLGYTVTIVEPLGPTSEIVLHCDGPCDALPWAGPEWAYTWVVYATYDAVSIASCDGPCDASLADYGTDDLVCTFEMLKPAHTTIHWVFTAAP